MIKVLCVGKLKETYLKEFTNDYLKRINKYHKISIVEIKDSDKENECKEIIKNLKEKEYIIILDIKGKKVDSLKFKEVIDEAFKIGNSNITFIIGGSEGVNKEVLDNSDKIISFSDLTFPHGVFRGILLEQIYRTFKIINNESYHK